MIYSDYWILFTPITRWVVWLASHCVPDETPTVREEWESIKTTNFVSRESGYEHEVKSEVRVSAKMRICGQRRAVDYFSVKTLIHSLGHYLLELVPVAEAAAAGAGAASLINMAQRGNA